MADPTPPSLDEMVAMLRGRIAWLEDWRATCARQSYSTRNMARLVTIDHELSVTRAIDAQLEASRWRPIAEAPKDADMFDFWLEWADGFGDGVPLGQSRWSRDQRFRGHYKCWSSVYTATHFMPLPAPPATASDGGEGE